MTHQATVAELVTQRSTAPSREAAPLALVKGDAGSSPAGGIHHTKPRKAKR